MKKPKSWIRVCVHLLLFITLGVQSRRFDVNPVTDDISRLSVLKDNIPEDYKIPVTFVPKEEGGMCWVTLNVYYLEGSLKELAHKFGNISSNRKDIDIFIEMLQELRISLMPLDPLMFEFECHYRSEGWPTAQYFDFVQDFLIAAQHQTESSDCEPPPCPTTPYPGTIEQYIEDSPLSSDGAPVCDSPTGCVTHSQRLLPEVVEQSLLSLLFIPLLAFVFLLVWKVRSRRNREDLQQNPGEAGVFTETEGNTPPLDTEISEKNQLNVIATV